MTVPMRAPAAAPVDEARATLSPPALAGGAAAVAAPSDPSFVRLLELRGLDDDMHANWRES